MASIRLNQDRLPSTTLGIESGKAVTWHGNTQFETCKGLFAAGRGEFSKFHGNPLVNLGEFRPQVEREIQAGNREIRAGNREIKAGNREIQTGTVKLGIPQNREI